MAGGTIAYQSDPVAMWLVKQYVDLEAHKATAKFMLDQQKLDENCIIFDNLQVQPLPHLNGIKKHSITSGCGIWMYSYGIFGIHHPKSQHAFIYT